MESTPEFKSWAILFVFHIVLNTLGNIQLFSPITYEQIVRQTGLLNLGMETGPEERKLWIQKICTAHKYWPYAKHCPCTINIKMFIATFRKISVYKDLVYYYFTFLKVFHTSINRRFLTGVWVTACHLKSSGLFSVFWPIVWMVSTRLLISMSFRSCTNPLIIIPRALIITGITVALMFPNFFSSLARSRLGDPFVSQNPREVCASHSLRQIRVCANTNCFYGQI